MYSGGIPHPEGYDLILSIPVDDGNIGTQLVGLLEHHLLDIRSSGVSVVLDRSKDQSFGIIHGRIIHDIIGTVYIFRKDDHENNCTNFIIEFGHQ